MRRFVAYLIFLSTLTGLVTLTQYAVSAQDGETPEPIKVVTKEIEPFVFVDGEEVSGFSIDLWQALAQEAGIEYEYEIVMTVQEQLEAVEAYEADAAIAAISITAEREKGRFFAPLLRSRPGHSDDHREQNTAP